MRKVLVDAFGGPQHPPTLNMYSVNYWKLVETSAEDFPDHQSSMVDSKFCGLNAPGVSSLGYR